VGKTGVKLGEEGERGRRSESFLRFERRGRNEVKLKKEAV